MLTKLRNIFLPNAPNEPATIPGLDVPELVETDTPIYEELATERGIEL